MAKILTEAGLIKLVQLFKGLFDAKLDKSDIVNDLTAGGEDKALSAEQGKVLFQSVDNGKHLLASAIVDKGQRKVGTNSSFKELADAIRKIETPYREGVLTWIAVQLELAKDHTDARKFLDGVWDPRRVWGDWQNQIRRGAYVFIFEKQGDRPLPEYGDLVKKAYGTRMKVIPDIQTTDDGYVYVCAMSPLLRTRLQGYEQGLKHFGRVLDDN